MAAAAGASSELRAVLAPASDAAVEALATVDKLERKAGCPSSSAGSCDGAG